MREAHRSREKAAIGSAVAAAGRKQVGRSPAEEEGTGSVEAEAVRKVGRIEAGRNPAEGEEAIGNVGAGAGRSRSDRSSRGRLLLRRESDLAIVGCGNKVSAFTDHSRRAFPFPCRRIQDLQIPWSSS